MKTRLLLTSLCLVSFHFISFKTQKQPPSLELPVSPTWSSVKTWHVAVKINRVHVFCAAGDMLFCMQT